MSKKWSDLRRSKVPDEAAARASGDALRAALALNELRAERGVTQAQLAEALGTGQGSVSALERRQDIFLSSLIEYVQALGGNVEIAAVFDGERYELAIGDKRELVTA